MAEKKQTTAGENKSSGCRDIKCPFHGQLKIRGRLFKGTVISKHTKRVCIEFDRTVFIRKYERFAKKRTRLHAWLPECLSSSINVGDYIEVGNCRQLSKIISLVVIKKIRDKSEKKEELK